MNNQYDIVSISIKVKPRSERRSLLSRFTLQVWLLVNIQSMLLKSDMLTSNQDEMVVSLHMQHRVSTNNNKTITTTEEQQ